MRLMSHNQDILCLLNPVCKVSSIIDSIVGMDIDATGDKRIETKRVQRVNTTKYPQRVYSIDRCWI